MARKLPVAEGPRGVDAVERTGRVAMVGVPARRLTWHSVEAADALTFFPGGDSTVSIQPPSDNPYRAPEAFVAIDQRFAPSTSEEVVPATQGKRFINMVIDGVCHQCLCFAAGFAIVFSAAMVSEEAMESMIELFDGPGSTLISLMIFVGYFGGLESLSGRTFGKMLTGTRVVSANGEPISFGQAWGRAFARLIPFEAFSFLGNKRPVGWHDSLSKTRVISNP